MTDNQLLERIVTNQNVLAGKPVIRGTRSLRCNTTRLRIFWLVSGT